MRLSQKYKATNWMRQSLPKNYQNPCTKNSEAWKFQEECMKWYMFDVNHAGSSVPLHSSAYSQNHVAMLNFGRVLFHDSTNRVCFILLCNNKCGCHCIRFSARLLFVSKVCRSAYEMVSESTNKTFKHTKRAWFFWYCFWLVVVVVGAVIIIIMAVTVTVVRDVVWSAKS